MRTKLIWGLAAVAAVAAVAGATAAVAASRSAPAADHRNAGEPAAAAGGGDAVMADGDDTEYELASTGGSIRVAGLTADGRLVTFKASKPDDAKAIGKVSGLKGDTRLVGIDVRVQDGKLYGVGDKGGIYTIGTQDAKAAKVSQLSVALDGKSFGVDFNPAANRLRVVSDTGQNLRHNIDDPNGAPAAGTTATDTALSTPPTAGTTAGVTAAAYTNNDLSADTATTLFDLNVTSNQVVAQSPANAGTLAPTGALTVDPDGDAGFDIYTVLRDKVSTGSIGFATLKVDGAYRFFTVRLLTGKATPIGAFPKQLPVVDIAALP